MSLRQIAVLFLLLGTVACQHQTLPGPAVRISSIQVQPGPGAYGRQAAQQMQSRLAVVVADINRQLPPDAPQAPMTVQFDKVKHVAPAGIFMTGRSEVSGKMQVGDWSFAFEGRDGAKPDVDEMFNLDGFYSPDRSFGRISDGIASRFAERYAQSFGLSALKRGEISRAAPQPLAPALRQAPDVSVPRGRAAPPPQVLVGG